MTKRCHISIYRRQSLGDPVMGRGSKLSPCHTSDSHTLLEDTKCYTILTLPYLWRPSTDNVHSEQFLTAFVFYQTRLKFVTHLTATLWYTIQYFVHISTIMCILELPRVLQYHAIPHNIVYPCIIPYQPIPCDTCDSWPSWYSLCLVTMVDESDTQKLWRCIKRVVLKRRCINNTFNARELNMVTMLLITSTSRGLIEVVLMMMTTIWFWWWQWW